MNFIKRAANARPELIFAIILVFYGILIFKIKNVGPVYGDSGLMYLQVKQIVDSHYSTFAFDYKGKKLDDQYRYAPYKKPFLAGVGEKHYIDFPPYYPLFGAPFYQLFGMRGLYVPGFLAIAGLLFLLIRFGKLFSFSNFQINSVLFLYSFASTPNLYSLVFHEYPVALLAITCALFYLSKYVFSEEKKIYLILFGLFSGISLFFRLELIFVIIPAGISTLIILRKNFVLIPALSLAGFLVPFIALLVLNQHIHGHPLGLRYYLTLTDNVSPDLKERMGIIYRMLFSETRGLFRQNPYYLFSFAFLPWLFKSRDNRIKFLYLILLFSSILILVTSPNDGDHIAPRYLFGILTVGTILFILVIASFPEKTAIRRILYFLVIVTVAISVRETAKKVKWILNSEKNVAKFNAVVGKDSSEIVIFREYASTLNLQNTYPEKIFFVAESDETLAGLISLLDGKKVSRFTIANNPLKSGSGFTVNNRGEYKPSLKTFGSFFKNYEIANMELREPLLFIQFENKNISR